MPKKTRQEKIIADLRRKLAQTRTVEYIIPKSKPETPAIKQPTVTPNPSPLPSFSLGLVKKDLTKTLLLTIIAISLEVVLYFYLG